MNIYVGNMPYSMTDAEVKELFGTYGTVDAVRIVMDRDSGRPKGFAFVVGVPQAFAGLEKMQNRIIRFVTKHSNVKPEILKSLIFRTDEMATDIGSVIEGEEAVEIGLIDEIGGLSGAMSWLRSQKKKSESEDKV